MSVCARRVPACAQTVRGHAVTSASGSSCATARPSSAWRRRTRRSASAPTRLPHVARRRKADDRKLAPAGPSDVRRQQLGKRLRVFEDPAHARSACRIVSIILFDQQVQQAGRRGQAFLHQPQLDLHVFPVAARRNLEVLGVVGVERGIADVQQLRDGGEYGEAKRNGGARLAPPFASFTFIPRHQPRRAPPTSFPALGSDERRPDRRYITRAAPHTFAAAAIAPRVCASWK